jgi:hypothetical protein
MTTRRMESRMTEGKLRVSWEYRVAKWVGLSGITTVAVLSETNFGLLGFIYVVAAVGCTILVSLAAVRHAAIEQANAEMTELWRRPWNTVVLRDKRDTPTH